MVPDDVRSVLQSIPRGLVVALTGAGVSAESGIPTFRGKEGYWQIGSRHYQPQEMATFEAFSRMPDEVWAWYLYRRGVCLAAEPNPAHVAFVRAVAFEDSADNPIAHATSTFMVKATRKIGANLREKKT